MREQTLWRVLYDTGAPALAVLALDAEDLDLTRHQTRARAGETPGAGLAWQPGTSELLRWLLAGRPSGPVFVTGRRAAARLAGTRRREGDVWRATGQARMSYRRAAQIFTELTRPLDPGGRGWTLHQLSAAGKAARHSRAPSARASAEYANQR